MPNKPDNRPATLARERGAVRTAGTRKAVRKAESVGVLHHGPRHSPLAGEARSALVERLGAVAASIAIDVCDGVVDMRGRIESSNQKRIAEETVRRIAGVRGVRNRLRVRPPSKLALRSLCR